MEDVTRVDFNIESVNSFILGYETLQISGPCFKFQDDVKVLIDNEPVDCGIIDNIYANCHTKYSSSVGRKQVKLTINGNQTFTGSLLVKNIQDRENIYGMEEYFFIDDVSGENTTIT